MNDSLRSTTQSSTAYKKNPLKPLLEDCRGVARRGFQVFRNLTFYNFRSRGTFYGIPLLKCRGMRYSLLENRKRKLIWKCITCYIEGYKRLQYKKMRINWTDHATLLLYTSLQYGILRLCLSRPFKRGTLVHTSKEKKEKKEEKYTLLTHHFKSGTGMTVSLPQCFTINWGQLRNLGRVHTRGLFTANQKMEVFLNIVSVMFSTYTAAGVLVYSAVKNFNRHS